MGIGVVDRHRVAVLEHPFGEDAVQVEGEDDGQVGADDAARFLQQVALRVELLGAAHGAVHGEVEAVGAVAAGGEQLCELRREPIEGSLEERPRRIGPGLPDGDQLHILPFAEHRLRAADLRFDAAVVGQQLLAAANSEILVAG